MKKVLLSIMLTVGAYTFTCAQAPIVDENPTVTVAQEDDGYKDVKLEDLSEKVQSAIKDNYSNYTVKSTSYNEEKKLAKVTFTSKEDQSEKIVILNEEGEELKEN